MGGGASWVEGFWTVPDGLRLHYRNYAGPSDQPPILCLPGLTRNARDFEALADAFAGQWRVLAIDFRGRGLSDYDPQPERYTPLSYADDTIRLLDELGIERAVFVGTSLGGIVTMLVAATQPHRIAGALLNDVGPKLGRSALDRIRAYVGKPLEASSWEEAGAATQSNNAAAFPTYSAAEWLRMAHRTCREDQGVIRFDYDMAIATKLARDSGEPPDSWPLVDAMAGLPVTLLRGEISDLLSAEVAQRMIDRMPRAVLAIVPATGHAPTFDEPEALAAVEQLLARIS